MNAPDVTVVIPCYNAERFVAQAIQSALDQGPNVEVIVVDDGSTDASLEVIESFGDRIRFETGPNRGACAARNAGLALARSEFLVFLDGDDFFDDGFLRRMLLAFDHAACDVILGRHRPRHSATHSPHFSSLEPSASRREIFRAWAECRAAQTGAIVWRRSFMVQIGGWRESLMQAQDIELGCRAMLLDARAQAVDVGYVVYRNRHENARITTNISEASLRSQVDAARALGALARQRSSFDRECIGRFAYVIARKAFRHGHPDLGLSALRLAREQTFAGHFGSVGHVFGAHIFGLQLKERLAVAVRPPRLPRVRATA